MTPPPRPHRFAALDSVRGVACLAVVAFHTTCYLNPPDSVGGSPLVALAIRACMYGWVGVPVFFVVSGYCIAASADSHRLRGLPVSRFYARRFRRIFPPLWVVIILWALVASVIPDAHYPGPAAIDNRDALPRPVSLYAAQWVGNLTLTEEWRSHLGGPPKNYLLGQVWTLCYEEQFYAVVGLILAVAPRYLFPAAAAVTALVFLNCADLTRLTVFSIDPSAFQWPARGFFFDGLWLAFAAGVAVYYRLNRATPLTGWGLEGILAVAAFATGRGIAASGELAHNLHGSLMVAFTTAVILCRLFLADRFFASSPLLAPTRFAGRMCYSLYLVHPPVVVLIASYLSRAGLVNGPAGILLVAIPVCTAASVAVAYPFYRLVERRFAAAPG